ncbi:MAG: 50S ribosomal protein L23 [Myxococcota bacterium]
MSGSLYSILKRPVITEKTNRLREENNQYVFEVKPDTNKVDIRRAVEALFSVRVTDVRTMGMRGKVKRFRRGFGKKPNWKKAIVTVREGEVIDIFEGV